MVKKSSLLPRDSRLVGLQSKVEDIVGLLEDPKVPVIAVVGMGGSGKTFLLQNVYKAAKSKYDQSIWLSISKSYTLKNLQDDIASHIGINSKSVSEERAAELIHDHLQGNRSFIVLDDLWTLSTENSLIDKLGRPADKDCKIVVTTRNRQVALNSNSRIYEMQNLSDEDSWMLFCIYAFPNSAGNRAPQHMEEEGRKIGKQCGNLPLAIKTIAASLANTKLKNWEWKRIMTLPPHLKPCFAYLSFFPEDEKIEAEYLINLWIAEGFIPAGEEQWDLAWHWLDQLDKLCMLQVYEKDDDIFIKYCKIHDLLHDLAIHISREDNCVFSVEEVSSRTSNSMGWCRILLANKGLHVFNAISESRPVYLRTLSLSQNWQITSIPENLFTTMRGLRVLDLSYTHISTLPASLGKMILLRLLNLRGTEIKEVPECVRHLKRLLFLALPDGCESLPAWISDLRYLQHLRADCIYRMPRIANLRTLDSFLDFRTEEDKFTRLDNLVDMTQLQKLRLFLDNEMELKRIEEGILAQLVKMRCLAICNNRKEFREFPGKMRAMKHLESLRLCLFVVPSWICEFANLKQLELIDCECNDYPELERMPNLLQLSLIVEIKNFFKICENDFYVC
ncbi:probable disease resistance protein At1g58390 [Cryptomeria japonica]|uniref:probable disease resistance protein At1g58390 n=1 Tax=Cryptomeria japonica TaxID=3369 RepID=UPI0027DA955C|nr:probable disease resistance protein At1g58390 [Cryptomeria japonica]